MRKEKTAGMGATTPCFRSMENPYKAPLVSSDKLVVGAMEGEPGGTGFDSRRAWVTLGSILGRVGVLFVMALGMCGECAYVRHSKRRLLDRNPTNSQRSYQFTEIQCIHKNRVNSQ